MYSILELFRLEKFLRCECIKSGISYLTVRRFNTTRYLFLFVTFLVNIIYYLEGVGLCLLHLIKKYIFSVLCSPELACINEKYRTITL